MQNYFFMVAIALVVAQCTPTNIDLGQVREMTIHDNQEVDLPPEQTRQVLDQARCIFTKVLWKGGTGITMTMNNGQRHRVSGVSHYGRFIRIHRKQWCRLTDQGWNSLIRFTNKRPMP